MSFARTSRRWLGVLAAVALLCSGAGQAAGPDVKVQLMGSYQTAGNAHAKWASLDDKTKVAPGDRILYKIQVTNHGDRDARHASALGPIPAGTTFVAGTATTSADLRVDYSVDGGKSFSASPTITVTDKDGKTQVVPAPAERYTTVRWTWNAPLPAGAEANVSYEVKVR
jgi:uncharacterized repeat protein (TIGR01451 family)